MEESPCWLEDFGILKSWKLELEDCFGDGLYGWMDGWMEVMIGLSDGP